MVFLIHSFYISIFVVHADMDMDSDEWSPHEYWKMKILSMHKNPSTGEKWVVGTWFYTPSQLKDAIKVNDRYSDLQYSVFYMFLFDLMNRKIIDLMGNTELILSTHRDVINPSCIQCRSFFSLLSSILLIRNFLIE